MFRHTILGQVFISLSEWYKINNTPAILKFESKQRKCFFKEDSNNLLYWAKETNTPQSLASTKTGDTQKREMPKKPDRNPSNLAIHYLNKSRGNKHQDFLKCHLCLISG